MSIEALLSPLTPRAEESELRDALDGFTRSIGFSYYTYVSGKIVGGRRMTNFDPRERPFHLTNIPADWQSEYSRRRYYDHDPIMLFALHNLMPERWTNVIRRHELSPRQRKIVEGAADAGLREGLIVPVHGPGGEFAVLSLSHDQNERQAPANVEADEGLIHLFALRFHAIARGTRQKSELTLPAELTSREIDVLFWTAEGKSTWDISRILGISEATVNFHINSAKRKLGVHSKPHAVAKMFSFSDRRIV